MEPSMWSTEGMSTYWSQISETCYQGHETTSRGPSNDHGTQNWTQNEVLIPVPKHVQGSQFPSNLIGWDEVPQQSITKSPTQTWVVASKKVEFEVKEPIKQKRYRKRNLKKITSVYRGVTKSKGKGLFESFVWDKDPKTTGKKGKTVYIGGFKNELEAARAHDLIAIKIWGKFAYTNFPESCYSKEILETQSMSVRECILAIRRRSKNNSTAKFDGCNISSSFARASVGVEENNAIGDALPNLDTTKQSLIQEIGQKSQTPTTLQNQHGIIDENQFMYDDQYLWSDLAFQNDPSFQIDASFPLWSYDFGNTLVEDRASALGNALNWKISMFEKGNENPTKAGNDGISSFGSSSIGFHPMGSNIQHFKAPNLQIAPVQRYEPLQYGFATNSTHS
ncbi:hypothetical protein AAZX31_02G169000 [Glycine max]|uniref:AP2/ERF domain-containing protein n=2 Tax=Glycine subgen. Soja TaxID=1462606 RepID=A0A0R0KYC7_SOYBN|nr:uncharacterized protein LOC102665149 [Glycine max]XP_028184690.1 uncharacterized protein LOC114371455 [Glycine soja]KAH1060893.1 hypothetical protein GYH30_004393 [Glycine max]KRH71937.1 hypothetical protein GLYMA_02G179500v4 [Glycine max]RZC25531.1 AP2-like ethylene-responsive transcription factor AIL7 [Glycine soja]|eukprot:XP_006575992.1 uncharacterized protein LOC102665149 [Glycine max]